MGAQVNPNPKKPSGKQKAGRRKTWWFAGGLVIFLALGITSFLGYSFFSRGGFGPALRIRSETVSVSAGTTFKLHIAAENRTKKQIKITSLVFKHPTVEQRFSLNKTNPEATNEELIEETDDTPRSLTFEFSPAIVVSPGRTERIILEGEAYEPGRYPINISAHIETVGFDLASYFNKPYASTVCRLNIYPKNASDR